MEHFTVVYQFKDRQELESWFKDNVAPNIIPRGGNIVTYMGGDIISEQLHNEEDE